MNKGLEIRNNKLAKKAKKVNTLKPEQMNICRFVEFEFNSIQRINGKNRYCGKGYDIGLQIQNKVYLLDGHFKKINSKEFKITKKYNYIPEWGTETILEEKYNKFLKENINELENKQ